MASHPGQLTQPGHPFVGRRNEYQPKGGDALRLGSKGRYVIYLDSRGLFGEGKERKNGKKRGERKGVKRREKTPRNNILIIFLIIFKYSLISLIPHYSSNPLLRTKRSHCTVGIIHHCVVGGTIGVRQRRRRPCSSSQ